MADVFGREELTFGGAFAADSAVVNFSTLDCQLANLAGQQGQLQGGVGMLAQQIQFSYTQPIQRFYELGAQKVYYFAGRPSGQGTIARMVGPRKLSTDFYRRLGNVCCADKNILTISAAAGCKLNGVEVPGSAPDGSTIDERALFYDLSGVVISSIGGTIAAEDMIFREALTFVFYKLKVLV